MRIEDNINNMKKNISPKQLGYALGTIVLAAVALRISQISGQSSIPEAGPSSVIASSSEEITPVQEEIGGEDLIVLDSPSPSQVQARKVSISGRARGTWFFEGSFPATITDENGNELAKSHVQAQSDWMTEDLVPFSGEISIPDGMAVPPSVLLRLEADDPSGGEGEIPPSLTLPLQIR